MSVFQPSQALIEVAPILRAPLWRMSDSEGWQNIVLKTMEEASSASASPASAPPASASGPGGHTEPEVSQTVQPPETSEKSQTSSTSHGVSDDNVQKYFPSHQAVVTQYAPWCTPSIALMTVDYIADLCGRNVQIPGLVQGADPKKDLNWVMVGADPITHKYQGDQYFTKL